MGEITHTNAMIQAAALRSFLPYGAYLCRDGSQALFSRSYCPMWRRNADGFVTQAKHNEWIEHAHQGWFYDDGCTPSMPGEKSRRAMIRCYSVLVAWGLESGGRPVTAYELNRQIAEEAVFHYFYKCKVSAGWWRELGAQPSTRASTNNA